MCEDDDIPGDPVCYADKLIGGHIVDDRTHQDVSRFRKAERSRLYAKRRQLTSSERHEKTLAVTAHLKQVLEGQTFGKIAVYWPIRGEPDLRPLMADLCKSGCTVLLPVVVERHAPLVFRPWHPGCDMTRGIWNIPVPASGETQIPEIAIAPLVGIDKALYRLGNGGGYYDRTLAALPQKPKTIGAGFAFCSIPSIFPMPWDIPMDMAVSEAGLNW